MIDVDQMEAAARAAAQGQWRECGADSGGCKCGQVWSITRDTTVAQAYGEVADSRSWEPEQQKANAHHIAMASPENVLALIKRLRVAEEQLTER